MRTMHFSLWLDHQTSKKIIQEAILDALGNPLKKLPVFEKRKGKQICLVGYQGYDQHSPIIQNFAQNNPENFAQVLMFAPLTANTVFSRFNEWFPVLMQFLRKKDKITRDEIVNYISGIASNKLNTEMPNLKGTLLPSIIDRGNSFKSELIEKIWNARETMYERYMEMANKGDFTQMMREFAMLPGVQPVKAGFMVQLAFGQLGCIDVHNIRMYSSIADMMVADPHTTKEQKEAWKEVKSKIEEGRGWNVENKNDPENENKVNKVLEAYSKLLKLMHHELSVTPRELWNLWVNYVAQRYSGQGDNATNAYSPDQGLVHPPDDPKLMDIFGKDRIWKHKATGDITASVIEPHPTSGAVSRVHLMAAIKPEDLLAQLEAMGPKGGKLHFINAALRSDPTALHAIEMLSERLNDAAQLEAILNSGANINIARKIAAEHNQKLINNLTENAKSALVMILTHQYRMTSPEAERIVEIYTNVLKSNYKRDIDKIAATLRGQGTKILKKTGEFTDDDEEIGYDKDFYDPSTAFAPGSKNISRLEKRINPYIPGMQALDKAKLASQNFESTKEKDLKEAKKQHNSLKLKISSIKKQIEKLTDELIPSARLKQKQSPDKRHANRVEELQQELTTKKGELRQTVYRKNQLAAAIKELEAEEIRISNELKNSKDALKIAGGDAISKEAEPTRKRLHGF